MKAVIWGYRFKDMKRSWAKQMVWLENSLMKNGFEVKKKDLICDNLKAKEYDCNTDNPTDVCIYNHIDISFLLGNEVKAKKNLFFKPTVPDQLHVTLDELGYGPFSSISFDKPDFESVDIGDFFDTKVDAWVNSGVNKWGKGYKEPTIEKEDYWLVLGQCGGDSVNTRHDFGHYFSKLKAVIRELARVDSRTIIVKLHPHTDGKDATDTIFSDNLSREISEISPRVEVYNGKVGIHKLIEGCRAVVLGNSGAGYEAMMHHKPIIAWGKPEYHWIAYDLKYLADMIRAIRLDWFDSEKQDKFLYWYLEKYCFYDQKTCDRRVEELCSEMKQ